jgi:hypothetical protein
MKKQNEWFPAQGGCSTEVPTWEELAAREPRLNDVLAEVRSIKDEGGPYFCKHEAWAVGWKDLPAFKKRIDRLVGWGSRHRDPLMRTCQAWEVVLEMILEALPPCRSCGCVYADGSFTC